MANKRTWQCACGRILRIFSFRFQLLNRLCSGWLCYKPCYKPCYKASAIITPQFRAGQSSSAGLAAPADTASPALQPYSMQRQGTHNALTSRQVQPNLLSAVLCRL